MNGPKHIRTKIREALAAELTGIGATVFPGRVDDVSIEELPAIMIYAREEEVETDGQRIGSYYDRQVNIGVDVFAARNRTADELLDTIAANVEMRLARCSRLGGLVESLDLRGSEIDEAGEAETTMGVIRLSYAATYRTPIGNPSGQLN